MRKSKGQHDTLRDLSREELQEAVRRFRKRGGLIRKLDAESNRARRRVGTSHGAYENVIDA